MQFIVPKTVLCIVVVLTAVCIQFTSAQKVLQLERAGSLKTQKIHIGESITFKLRHDDAGWYERMIFDLDPDTGYLNLEGVHVHVDSISMIKAENRPLVPTLIGTALQAGGANMILFDVSRGLTWDKERGIDETTVIAGAANVGVGTILKALFRNKVFKVGKRKRLRLLDLDFGGPPPPLKS